MLLEITNLDPESPVHIEADLTGVTAKSVRAETLTGAAVDSVNTFASPDVVVSKPVAVTLQNGRISLIAAPRSVTVVSMKP